MEQGTAATGQPDRDAAVRDCIFAMQRQFGARIERVLGQRGHADGGIQAGLVLMQALALAQAGDSVPEALLGGMLSAAEKFVRASLPDPGAEGIADP